MRRTTAWQQRRSGFNHDWLKNQYLPALAAFQNIIDGRLEAPDLEEEFLTHHLLEWEAHRDEAIALPREFESLMSPRSLFDRPPLSACDEETRGWLGDLVHHLWLARNPEQKWTADAARRAQDADERYADLRAHLNALSDAREAAGSAGFRRAFAAFRRACLDLARSIEQFPGEVQVS